MTTLMHHVRFLLAGALCIGAATLALTPTDQAHAAIGCRSDPIVTLPNGITVDLHVDIADTWSDVQHVDYVLHGPALSAADSAALRVTYPDGSGPVSSFSYVPDSRPHRFSASITVTTGASSVPVVGYLDWVGGGKHHWGTPLMAGVSGQSVQTPELRIVCANQCAG